MTEPSDETQYFGLAELLRVFGRRWRWIVFGVALGVGVALFLSLRQSDQYVASTHLLLRSSSDALEQVDPNAQQGVLADRVVLNEMQVMQSAQVRERVREAYDGDDVGRVNAEVTEIFSDGVIMSVKDSDRDEAAELANLYAEQYIGYSLEQRLDAIEQANAQIEERLASVEGQIEVTEAPLLELANQVSASPGDPTLASQLAILDAQLEPELEALEDLKAFYLRTRDTLAVTQGLTPTAVAQILSAAEPPGSPVSPKPIRDGAIGLMAGLGVGLALALAREFLDQSIRTSDDLERALRGRYPILGVIPSVSPEEIAVVSGPGSHTSVAEAYRALRTSVRFAELDRPMKVLQITSGGAGEGKTTTTANLARMLTQAGHRVAIACGDLRRPTIHELLGVPRAPGLADVVVGERSLAEAVSQVDPLTYVLAAGTPPPNPSELLGSSRAERVFAALAEEMDYTVIDTTPVLPVTDAIVLSRLADATLVVVRAGTTSRRDLEHTLAALEQASAPIIGIVLNRAPQGDRNSYGYNYAYEYYYRKGTTSDGKAPELPEAAEPAGSRS